ncbi:MAG: hypothetical protein NXY57DRAFT_1112904 [Lentinula lateritia]|nr:MAG: hypothetical protein NXY57DRAFT_1112904 [Lentinula lateritia]
MRKAQEMDEMKQTMIDAMHKLNTETSRVLQLETSLNKATLDLQNSSLNVQNTSAALASTEERLRLKDLEAKELENALVSLSQGSEGQQSQLGKMEQAKSKLEARVKELESTLKATVIPQNTPTTPARCRSSSLSDLRITTLENELTELRDALVSRSTEVQTIQARLAVAQRDALKANNDQMASEARLKTRMVEMENLLAEREEELRYLREQGGAGGLEREEELIKRIDEDDAKIEALERLIGDTHDLPLLREKLAKCEEKLRSEISRVSQLEGRNTELVQENEKALNDLEEGRCRITELDTQSRLSSDIQNLRSKPVVTPDLNPEAVANMERLLGAVDRLRGERNGLRRDMHFLETESKFTIAALEAKITSLSFIPASPEGRWKEIKRLRSLVLVCSLVVCHLETDRTQLEVERNSACSAYEEKSNGLASTEIRLHETEDRLTTTIQLLEETTTQRNDAMSRLSALDMEWRTKLDDANIEQQESRNEVDHLNASMVRISQMLEAVTSERDSLSVQVTNLDSEIASARQELTEAESRYTQLQFHQLSDMPSTQATKTLRSQIEELEGRVMRRTEQIGIHQHDIRRLETNLRLHEERLAEMTTEMEMIVAQKDAMVEDCADARDQRDEAILKIEKLEEDVERLENLLEDRNQEQEAIIEVILLEEHDNTLHNVQTLNQALEDVKQRLQSSEQDAKRTAESLASSQAELTRSLMSTEDLVQMKIDLSGQVRELEDQLGSRVTEVSTLTSQLENLQQESSSTIKQRADTIALLESQLESARSSMSLKETEHRVALEDLQQHISQKDRDLALNDLEGDLVQLKMKHVEELGQLQSRLVEITAAFDELQARHHSSQVTHEQSLAESAESKTQVEKQLREAIGELTLLKEIRESLEAASQKHLDQARQLEDRVAAANSELTLGREKLNKADESVQRNIDELAKARQEHEKVLAEARDTLAETLTRLEEESTAANQSREQASALQRKLEEEAHGRLQDRSCYEEALQSAKVCQEQAELRVDELGQNVSALETQIRKAVAQIQTLQEEKKTAEREMTTLEAKNQRSLSLNRHLESQIRESELTIANLGIELENVNNHLAKVEKACSAAEVNLSLQNTQHKREVSQLHHELEALKGRPDLESVVAELEERINEMEDLLRRKCEEIEENDDIKLGLMKENKSLKTKVESLSRKVSNLQTKLVAAKATLPAPTIEQRIPSTSSPASASTSSLSPSTSVSTFASTSRPRSNTMIGAPGPSDKVLASAVPDRLNRVVSVPSALPRPKTPERRNVLGPVLRAMSPKKDKPKTEPAPAAQSKKRRAPDDFEGYEIPPQAFTVESLPGDGEKGSEHATPKIRRVLSNIQTGFTPARHQNRSTIPMPSPKRSNPVFIKSPPSLPDFSNSASLPSVGQPADGKKRSWLGKIRGASSATIQRDFP